MLHQLYAAIDRTAIFALFHPRLSGLILVGLVGGCGAVAWTNRKDDQ